MNDKDASFSLRRQPIDVVSYLGLPLLGKLWGVYRIENPDDYDDKTFKKEGNLYFQKAR